MISALEEKEGGNPLEIVTAGLDDLF